MRALVDEAFPAAERVVVVLDNLNTHDPASLYKAFPPTEAARISCGWNCTTRPGMAPG